MHRAIVQLDLVSVNLQDSTTSDARMSNWSRNYNANKYARGPYATANTGSVNMEGSQVNHSVIQNRSTNLGTRTTAIGTGAIANTGSVNIQ